MKLVPLKNASNSRMAFPVRGLDGTKLVIDPGEVKLVSPATVKHPSVSRYIGQGLEVGGDSTATPKQKEPEKRIPAPPPAPLAAPTPQEVEKEEPKDEPKEPAEQPAGDNLRELYLAAPGIDSDNVDIVLEQFPTPKTLSEASRAALSRAGVSKSSAGRLIEWAKAQ